MSVYSAGSFLRWGPNTKNTPYKAGKTSSGWGYALVMGDPSTQQTLFAMAQGTNRIFTCTVLNNVSNGWQLFDPNLRLEYNDDNGNLVVGARMSDGTGIQLATTVNGIQLQRKVTADGEWEILWYLTK